VSSATFIVRAPGPVTHVFDTGAAKPQRTLLQQGAVAILAPLKRPVGYLQDVIPFGACVRSYTDAVGTEMLVKAFNRTPAIAIATGTRAGYDRAIGSRMTYSTCELLVYIATQHSRDPQRGRQEIDNVAQVIPQADPGLHVMMEHAAELLIGAFPATSTTIKQIWPEREEELATTPEITIWLQTYGCKLQSAAGGKEWRTAAQLLESIGWRTTTNPSEPNRPAPAETSTTIDVDTDLT
jgi:hypothetical protein